MTGFPGFQRLRWPWVSALILLLSFAALPGRAQTPELGFDSSSITDKPLVTLHVGFDQRAPKDRAEGIVTATIAEGWHINSATPKDEFAIPTVLTIQSEQLATPEIRYPAHTEREFAFAGGKLAVYEGSVPISFGAPRPSGQGRAVLTLRYQACNDKVCLRPSTVKQELIFPSAFDIPLLSGKPAPENFLPLSAAPAGAKASLFSSDVAATFASRGLALTLIAIFVLGLALNLTPCVYPLIPITIAFFSSQAEGRRSQRVILSVAYVLGIAVTYSALGVFSALSGKLFGAWLQQPGVLIFFALLMLALSASMFGLFDITVPHFITDRAGARGGAIGALTMGLLVGIVAAPCVGPFVISLIALVSQLGDPVVGFILFFVLALGLGFPYLLLGIFSSGLTTLPRSGIWMLQVKKAMGFILIAMAFFFVRPLIGETAFHAGAAASLVIGSLILFWQSRGSAAGRGVRIAAATLLLAGGFLLGWPRSSGAGLSWRPFDQATLAAAKATGRPVIIDFYATWCLPCKELDAKTFTDAEVMKEGDRFVRLKADLTNAESTTARELSKKYGIVGVPTIVFIDPTGREVTTQRLTGFEPPGKFVVRMRAVKSE